MIQALLRRVRALQAEIRRLHRENTALRRERREERRRVAARSARLAAENLRLKQRVRALLRQVWGKKSERSRRPQKTPAGRKEKPPGKTSDEARDRQPRGPRPFDPALPREKIKLPDPEPKDRICPVSGELMQPGFSETIEVLAFIPATVVVRQFERTVFVSRAKSAPVCTPWPEDILARSRVDASVLAHLAAEHYCEHAPFNRMEKKLARAGVRLSRATQVSLMKKLDQRVAPAGAALKAEVMKSGYIHLDATPVPLCDPQRPGGTVESTVWGYRANNEPVCWPFRRSLAVSTPKSACGLSHIDAVDSRE